MTQATALPAPASTRQTLGATFAPQHQIPPPQRGIPAPSKLMPVRHLPAADLWVVGAHGGSGESVVAGLDPRWGAAGHCFPAEGNLLVCCSTSAYGLESGRMALQQYISGFAGQGRLIGLALVTDMPGRLPKELRRLKTIIQSLAPATIEIPFDRTLRLEPYPPTNNSNRFSRQRALIESLISS